MKFRTGLFQARGQIAFIVGLAVASALAVSLDRAQGKPVLLVVAPPKGVVEVWKSTPSPVARPLSDDERREALIAWQYFRNNTQKSGMVNSVDKYPSTTMWDTGSALLATMSAERLGIITRSELDGRLATMLGSLARMQLFTGVLPNKSYDTTSMLMVDYANKPAPDGIGWSAVDLARLVLALRTVAWQYPEQTEAVRQVLRRWDTRPMLRDGLLYGARRKNGKVDQVQEGRLGYEEYAARALMLDGRDASAALAFASELKYETVDGVRVPTDRRTSRDRGAFNYVVSEPYILTGLELGWDYSSRQFAYSVYKAQENRFLRTHILTAATEDHVDRAPYFVYNTVFAEGKAWNAITDTGKDAGAFRAMSVKAAFGWDALYATPYTKQLARAAGQLSTERGYYAGRYEATGKPNTAVTCNTNAVVLESLVYRTYGPLMNPTAVRAE